MSIEKNPAFRALMRPLRRAMYKNSPAFREDVEAEIGRLVLANPGAPADLARMKLKRPGVPGMRRAVWRAALRDLQTNGPPVRAGRQEQAQPSAPDDATIASAQPDRIVAEDQSVTQEVVRIDMLSETGPGSEADRMLALVAEGRYVVTVEVDDRGLPCLLYRPAG